MDEVEYVDTGVVRAGAATGPDMAAGAGAATGPSVAAGTGAAAGVGAVVVMAALPVVTSDAAVLVCSASIAASMSAASHEAAAWSTLILPYPVLSELA